MKLISLIIGVLGLIGDSMMTKDNQNIYAKLMVALGDDPTNEMQCVAEFMKDPDDLKKIALEKGSKVLIDNKELNFDDSYYPNYVLERKRSEFLGKHKWTINIANRFQKEFDFEVVPFLIKSTIPEKIGKVDLRIECENLKSTDRVFLMLTADFSDKSETYLDIEPQNGYFIIPKEFLQKVDPIKVEMHFNISRIQKIDDDYFTKGVEIEWTKITNRFNTQIVR